MLFTKSDAEVSCSVASDANGVAAGFANKDGWWELMHKPFGQKSYTAMDDAKIAPKRICKQRPFCIRNRTKATDLLAGGMLGRSKGMESSLASGAMLWKNLSSDAVRNRAFFSGALGPDIFTTNQISA